MLMRPALMSLFTSITVLLVGSTPARAERLVEVMGSRIDSPPSAVGTPFGVDFDPAGNMLVVDMTGQHVYRQDAAGHSTTIAGTGEKGQGGDGEPALKGQFNGPHNLITDLAGNIYVADTWNNRVRKIEAATGKIVNFAGTGKKGFSGDGGPALSAEFGGIYCVAFNPDCSQLYLADLDNRRIRAIDMKTLQVSTVAGNGKKGVPADGAEARTSPLVDPRAVAADDQQNVYVLERGGNALRVVDRAGKIRTVAGTGKSGLSGDGGDARAATFSGPKHLCLDRQGDVIIADTDNHVIRKYNPKTGIVLRVAGTGKTSPVELPADPLVATLNQPHGVYVNRAGVLFIVDSYNRRVLKLVP
jgi:DNA-binding beta-propeller fold protein YncE